MSFPPRGPQAPVLRAGGLFSPVGRSAPRGALPASPPYRAASPAGPPALFGAVLAAAACNGDPAMAVRDLGEADACTGRARWPQDATLAEEALAVRLSGARTAASLPCADAPLPPLAQSPELRCAARIRAEDLSESGTIDETGDAGPALAAVAAAAYRGLPLYELRAADFLQASEVEAAMAADPAYCSALSDPQAGDVGVGARRDPERGSVVWVVLLGRPAIEG